MLRPCSAGPKNLPNLWIPDRSRFSALNGRRKWKGADSAGRGFSGGSDPGPVKNIEMPPKAGWYRGMCGRFTNKMTWEEIVRLYRLTMDRPPHNMQPSFNVCPTDPVLHTVCQLSVTPSARSNAQVRK
jgi:hypothetical protein